MTLSVIIPAYNSARFLGETLDALLTQTLRDVEIVVVDDGSTDETRDVVRAYQKKTSAIRLIAQENAGVSAARNRGLGEATGDYVVFLDADDFYAPDTLEAFVTRAKETGADLVLGRLCNYTDGAVTGMHAMAETLAAEPKVEPFDKRLLWNFLVCNKCYRRTFLLEHGVRFPATGFSEEGAFFMDAVYAGAVIAGTAKGLSYYRRHTEAQGASVSQTASKKNLDSLDGSMRHIFAAAQKALAAAGRSDDDYLQEILYKHAHILVSQFYRALWRMDDAALDCCVNQISALKEQMTAERFSMLCDANPDLSLRDLRTTKADAAARPLIAITAKRADAAALRALTVQTCPLFTLTLPALPDGEAASENVTTAQPAKNVAVRLRFGSLPVLNSATLQTLLRLPIPKTALTARLISLLLKRRHGA